MALKNIPLRVFLEFLRHKELNHISTEGGHYKYSRQDLSRPVIVQSHIDPVPEFIIRNNLRTIGSSRAEFEAWLASR